MSIYDNAPIFEEKYNLANCKCGCGLYVPKGTEFIEEHILKPEDAKKYGENLAKIPKEIRYQIIRAINWGKSEQEINEKIAKVLSRLKR